MVKLEIREELQEIKEDDLLVSYDFNSFYPSAQIVTKKTWPKIETTYPFKKHMSHAVCSLFNSKKWNDLSICHFVTVKYHNLENVVVQRLSVKEKIQNHTKTID